MIGLHALQVERGGWASLLFPLAVGLSGLPALLYVGGNALRNGGLFGLGLAALRADESRRGT